MRVYPSFASVAVAALLSLASVSGEQEYDVIVVGSGPGGLVGAEYLSRDPSVSVLILEAGLPSMQATGGADVPDYAKSKGWTQYDIPGEYDNAVYKEANEKYRVDWISGVYMWLGKLVGGCSTINAQLYFRTPDAYVTNMKWPFSPDHVNALMDENEQTIGTTDKPSPDGNWYLQEGYNIVANALRQDGYVEKTINDRDARNNKSKTFGHAPFTVKDGLRDAPAKSFWNKMKSRPNVKLVTSAMVNYIKQNQGQATGVVYNSNVEVKLSARGAIMMGAGALGTPKVLIQSGIGPRDQLELLIGRPDFPGVKQPWALNANVGQNLFDTNVVFASFRHPDMKSFQYKTYPSWALDQYMTKGQTGPWASFGPTQIGYENYAVNGRMYEFQTTVLTNGFTDYYSIADALTISIYVNNPESRDHSFFGADGKWYAFKGNLYMATKNDLAAMQSYATKIVNLMRAKGATFISSKPGESVADWVNSHRGWITHHFGGSCYVSGDAGDSRRCADEKMRVIGTKNIFVADASAMRDGTVNPYGFIMYTGREAAGQAEAHIKGSGSSATPSIDSPTCKIEDNVDYAGNDVAERQSPTAEGCCSICAKFNGCGAYTWTNYNGGTCWLKSAKGVASASPGVRSAVVGSAAQPSPAPQTPVPQPPTSVCSAIDENLDYSGENLGARWSATAEGCCAHCTAKAGCGAYTWTNYDGGTCWLKTAKGTATASPGARSAVVNGAATQTPAPQTPVPETPAPETPAPQTPAPQPPTSVCSAIDENFDYSGENLGARWSATAEGCCAHCTAMAGCGAYTWTNYDGGTCWLKSTRGLKTSSKGARSAVVNSAQQCNLVNGADYAGNDLTSAWAKTAAECCGKCRSHSGCKAFTWTKYDGGTCWLKSAVGSTSETEGAVGGTI